MSGGAGPALLRTATLNGGSLPVLALLNGPLALSRVPPPPPCRQKRAWQTSAVLEPLGCAAMAVFRVHQFCGGFNKASWPMWWREGNAWQTVAQCRGRQTMRRDCAAIAPALMTPPPLFRRPALHCGPRSTSASTTGAARSTPSGCATRARSTRDSCHCPFHCSHGCGTGRGCLGSRETLKRTDYFERCTQIESTTPLFLRLLDILFTLM